MATVSERETGCLPKGLVAAPGRLTRGIVSVKRHPWRPPRPGQFFQNCPIMRNIQKKKGVFYRLRLCFDP